TPAFFTILYFGDDSLGALLVLSQVVLSLQLGFAIIPLIHFNSDKTKMKEFTIKTWVKILAWLCALIIVALNAQLAYQEISTWIIENHGHNWWIYVFILPVVAGVIFLLIYVSVAPLIKKKDYAISSIPHGGALTIDHIEKLEYSIIGIPVDFSAKDRDAIRHALIQGGKTAKYFLIHSVETAGAQYHRDKVMDLETQSDTSNLQKYQQNLKDLGYQAEILIGYGTASDSIVKAVKANNIELLVMGAHGHKGLSDIIFGTTLDKVRHHVNTPILIIK
ncbi:MAG TPA: universal stress protein, partial [Daejeonella sp.]|nr:universal stress protein [Daejeonella sp.]